MTAGEPHQRRVASWCRVCGVIGFALLLWSTVARAAPRSWEIAPDAPFSMHELVRAIAARSPGGQLSCDAVSITTLGAQVLVRCDDTSRGIELGGRRGADAARAAAVVLLELSAVSPQVVSTAAAPRAAPEPAASWWEVRGRVAGAIATGVATSDLVQHGLLVAVDVELHRWGATLGVGYDRSRHNSSVPTPDVTRVVASAALWRRVGAWSLGAHAVAVDTTISRTASHRAWLWGVGPVARGHTEIEKGHWIYVETAASWFPHRLRISPIAGAHDLLTTPHLQLQLSIGYQWRFGGR